MPPSAEVFDAWAAMSLCERVCGRRDCGEELWPCAALGVSSGTFCVITGRLEWNCAW